MSPERASQPLGRTAGGPGPDGSPLQRALRSALSRDTRIRSWQLRSVWRRGLQSYLVRTDPENVRRVSEERNEVTVFVTNGERLGRATMSFSTGDERDVSQRIDQLVYMAGLGGDAQWSLPRETAWPEVEIYDPELAEDRAGSTSRKLVEDWRAAVAREQAGVKPSSMELFCGEEWTTLENSAGLRGHTRTTRVSLLTLLLASGERAAERYSWDERRRAADLDVAALVHRVAEEARDLTHAAPPPSGQYAVVIDADEIPGFLAPIQTNASAESLYQKSSRFEVGKPLPIEGKDGEPLNVVSNAIVPYGLTSYAFDADGTPGQRVELIKDGVFARPWATKQFADYLKTTSTGAFANWELPVGTTPLSELLAGSDRVLYVRSFSWLTPDANRGGFGTEIRVGYLHQGGQRTPVKGGTVSGNVFQALGTARYSKEKVFLGDYLGPAAVRFEGLTIAGA